MDDISDLLKEAKPLYFARKRRRNQIKATLGMCRYDEQSVAAEIR